MSLFDRVLQLIELLLLCLCLITTGIYSIRVKNLERRLEADNAALMYEVGECEERCKRMTYTCIDILNQIVLEGENIYDGN